MFRSSASPGPKPWGALVALLAVVGCSAPIEEDLTVADASQALNQVIEAESMTLSDTQPAPKIIKSPGASGRAVIFYVNGHARTAFTGAASRLQLRARAQLCSGAPVVRVLIDGSLVMTSTVSTTTWQTFATPLTVAPGTHTLEVRFDNDYASRSCDRNLILDWVQIETMASAPPGSVELEGESMALDPGTGTTVAEAGASGGRTLMIWSNGTASGGLGGGGTGLTLVARADLCDGAPTLAVSVDGRSVGQVTVTTTSLQSYAVPVALASGAHQVALTFTNDHLGTTCDRNVFIDKIAVASAAPPPPAPDPAPAGDAFVIQHDTTRGRIRLVNTVLELEFGYKLEAKTHNNQGGGNLYAYFDKRFDAASNIIAVWDGGSSGTKAFASGAGGIGSTQIYAVPDIGSVTSADYRFALADNAADGALRSPPQVTTLPDGTVELVFDVAVTNRDWSPSYEWYTVRKTWLVSPTGRISLRQDWRISRSGYFSEPAVRNQVSTMFKTISRWGHNWSDAVSGPPGTNSRLNPKNQWYRWVPNPTSVQECNAPDGFGGSQDALHADFNRFHDGAPFDFWFWPDNDGLGFEGLGQYRLGYQTFGRSSGSTINEICHHNRALVGDGADAYNLGIMAWWGGDGVPADRFKFLAAGVTWTDSYQMEARPRGEAFPVEF